MFTQYQLFNPYSTSNILVNIDYQIYIYAREQKRGGQRWEKRGEKEEKRGAKVCVCAVIFIPPLVCVNTLPMRRCRRS